MRRDRFAGLTPSQRELDAQQEASFWQNAGGTGSAIGGALGTAGGTALGLLAPPFAAPLAAAGGVLGGLAGGLTGSALDDTFGGVARARAQRLAMARQRLQDKQAARQEALQRMLSGAFYE